MSNSKEGLQMKTQVEGRDLVIERILDAPRDLVFKVFSESDHLASWWGPKGWETENYRFEFKQNGVWHYCMRCTDKNQGEFYGQESWGRSVFQEIVVPEKIVYTDTFADEKGNPAESAPEMLITLKLDEYRGKTKLTLRTQFASEQELQNIMDMGVVQGITSQYDKLDEYLLKIK